MTVIDVRLSWVTHVAGLVCRCHGHAYHDEWAGGADHDDDYTGIDYNGGTIEQPIQMITVLGRSDELMPLGPWQEIE